MLKSESNIKQQWHYVFITLLLAYFFLTSLFYLFGYLNNLDQRIVGLDSVYYYAYLPSILFDFDVDFTNELQVLLPEGLKLQTALELPTNYFSIGPAIFWLPFFLLAHLVVSIGQLFDFQITADPFAAPYTTAVYLANSFYGLLGILLSTLILKKYVKPIPALLAALSIMYATQMTYYLWSFNTLSHNVSFASTALFLLLWLNRGISAWTAVAAGLMVLARWQNLLFLLPLVVIGLIQFVDSFKTKSWQSLLKKYVVFGLIFCMTLMPQLIVWKMLYGAFITIPQGNSFLDFTHLPLFSVLFSLWHGLFSWHPILLFALVGMIWAWRKHKVIVLAFLSVFVLQWILNAAVYDWWAGWSFGQRRFISLLPFFAIGLGFLFHYLIEKYKILFSVSLIVFLLSIWNQLFLVQYFYGLIPRGDQISYQQMTIDKFYIAQHLKLREYYLKAMSDFQEGNVKGLEKYATNAYLTNPYHLHANMLYGLSCIVSNNTKNCEAVFKNWYHIAPTNIFAQYTAADISLKKGDKHTALGVLSNCKPEYVSLCQSLQQKVGSKDTKTLLDKRFYNMYIKKLELITINYAIK